MSDYIPQLDDKVKNSQFYKFGPFTGTVVEVLVAMARVRFDDQQRTTVVLGNRFIQLVSRPGDEPKLTPEETVILPTIEFFTDPPPVLDEDPLATVYDAVEAKLDEEPEKITSKKPGSKH
jgi:hypothetical protein